MQPLRDHISDYAKSNQKAIFPLWLGGLFILAGLLVGCGGNAGPPRVLVERTATIELPTAVATVAPSPSSTRVLTAATQTPIPTAVLSPTVTPLPAESTGLVVEVLNATDMLVVLTGDPMQRPYTVTYIGVAPPPPDNAWAPVAAQANRRLTALKLVRLVQDGPHYDDAGRLRRHVFLNDQLTSVTLLERGLLRANLTNPDTQFSADIEAAEDTARRDNTGLWGPPPTTPAEADASDEAEAEAAPITVEEPDPTATTEPTATSTITPEPADPEQPTATPLPELEGPQ